MPKTKAPTGRITRVAVVRKAMSVRETWKSSAISL
jgi:hypothetical protein